MSPAAVRWWPAVRASVRRDPDEPTAQYGSSPDSPLEGTGFEPSVPPFRSGVPAPTAGAVRRGLFAGAKEIRTSGPTFKGNSRTPSRFLRSAAPAAIVLISENDDFELPASQSNLPRRAT